MHVLLAAARAPLPMRRTLRSSALPPAAGALRRLASAAGGTPALPAALLRCGDADALSAHWHRHSRAYDFWAHFAAALRLAALDGGAGGAAALAAPHVLTLEKFGPTYAGGLRAREAAALAYVSAVAQRTLPPRLHAALRAGLAADAARAPRAGGHARWRWPAADDATRPLPAAHFAALGMPRGSSSGGGGGGGGGGSGGAVVQGANLAWALARQQLFVPAAFASLAGELVPDLVSSGTEHIASPVLLQLLWALVRGGGGDSGSGGGGEVAAATDALSALLRARSLAYPQQALVVWCLATAGRLEDATLRALAPVVFAPAALARLRTAPDAGAQQQLFQAHALLRAAGADSALNLPPALPAWVWSSAAAKAAAPAEDAAPAMTRAVAGVSAALRALRIRHVVGYAMDGFRVGIALPAARMALEIAGADGAAGADAAKARYLAARGWQLAEVHAGAWRAMAPAARLAHIDELMRARGERERAHAAHSPPRAAAATAAGTPAA